MVLYPEELRKVLCLGRPKMLLSGSFHTWKISGGLAALAPLVQIFAQIFR